MSTTFCFKCHKDVPTLRTDAYGDVRCEDCFDDYLMTDRGKVEYMISICNGDTPLSDYDADFLGYVGVCWKKYRADLNLTLSDLWRIEDKAAQLGLL